MWGHIGARLSPCSPVGPDELVRVGLQEQPPQHVLHAAADVALGDAPQPGVHAEGLTARHVLQEGIKLRAVPDPLLDLGGEERKPRGSARQQVCTPRCPGTPRGSLCTSKGYGLHVMGDVQGWRGRCTQGWG